MEKKTFTAPLEIKLRDDTDAQAMSFSGYGAYFGNVDDYGDIIASGAFTDTLADHKTAGTSPVMLWNHDGYSLPIGVWIAFSEDEKGLIAEGQFLDTTAGRDAYTAAKAGAVSGLSIGYIVTDFEMVKLEGKTVRKINAVKLVEVSVVTFPANAMAQISDVKSEDTNMNEEITTKIDALSATLNEILEAVKPAQVEDAEASADEAKYNQTDFLKAVTNLISETKQERNV